MNNEQPTITNERGTVLPPAPGIEDNMRLQRIGIVVLVSFLLVAGSVSRFPAQEKEARTSLTLKEGPDLLAGLYGRLKGRRSPVVAVVERVRGAVVNIHSERTLRGSLPSDFTLTPSQSRVNGMGTGIVIDPRGYIVTNHHVIEDVSVIHVRTNDGASHSALVVARSPEMDLALLKIDPAGPLPVMPLGTASDLMVGETVVAIGNAYGYAHTVSAGIVSAIKRDVSLNKDMSYKSLIQTDASINPGNSGGPLLNINGELVGVNVAIRAGAQGIGFAIPVDSMIRVVADMLHARRRNTVYDGVFLRDRLDPIEDGLVRRVVVDHTDAASPAGAAGLKKGDIVEKVGDIRVACTFDFERALLERTSGEVVPITVRRQSREQRLEVTLAAPPRNHSGPNDLVWTKLGLRLRPINAELVSRVNSQLHGGLEVTAVDGDSAAARAGIRRGDILVGLHQWETVNLDNVAFVLGHPDLSSFNPLSFFIVRSGQVRRGWISQVN
jgi:serine protease Do